jgi:integrase
VEETIMPRRVIPLTDVQIRNAKPRDKPYALTDGHGLYVEIMPTGSKLWRMKFPQRGRGYNRLSFGPYPVVTLQEAREKRLAIQRMLLHGIDPAQDRDDKKRLAQAKAANTFEKVAREWHSNKVPTWSARTADNTLRRLELDIFPEIGRRPIHEIKHRELIDALRKIESRGSHEVAHRIKAVCAQIFSYGIQIGLLERNIAADMKDVLKTVRSTHFAAIDSDELPAFLASLRRNESRMLKPTLICLRLMMLIFVRTSELIETPWKEIDLEKGEWIIPWQRMKRGKLTVNPDTTNHHVCLSWQALVLLRELHTITGGGTYLFPNQRDHTKPLSNNAILKSLERMGYKGKMTGHGFRALAMTTIKERLGYRHEVIDRQLAHAPPDKLSSAYDRAQYLAERKVMMQAWADYLDSL